MATRQRQPESSAESDYYLPAAPKPTSDTERLADVFDENHQRTAALMSMSPNDGPTHHLDYYSPAAPKPARETGLVERVFRRLFSHHAQR
ncbi:hypothetical protein VB773_18070 [Haloarculaceae archaeon H-GB2-1]|nr:hypothetical protein [Haloarculaceae archaeon H-GB1-1]MEA5387794.1 hypothetical protein [Haloarculaceae archaeon H-GB11]MEA5409293.1 hypothetical protein [Haloarculaceae archaeon H-GB2-1]